MTHSMVQIESAVIVSGLPASGKTTLSRLLAAELRIPHLDKDDLLESLFESEKIESAKDRTRLSRIADDLMRVQASGIKKVIVSSWWRHPLSAGNSGTPTDWLVETVINLVEVFCSCPAELAVKRFQTRKRHPGHFDSSRSNADLLAQLGEAEKLGPLFPSRAILYDTSEPNTPSRIAQLADRILNIDN